MSDLEFPVRPPSYVADKVYLLLAEYCHRSRRQSYYYSPQLIHEPFLHREKQIHLTFHQSF